MWMKFRRKWSSGYDKWEWRDLGDCKTLKAAEESAEDHAHEIGSQNHWSEHFRGVDWEVHELPPRAVMASVITACNRRAEAYLKSVERYTAELDKCPVEEPKA